jgi:hypothetical protein
MTAPDIITQLVERFDRNRDDYIPSLDQITLVKSATKSITANFSKSNTIDEGD